LPSLHPHWYSFIMEMAKSQVLDSNTLGYSKFTISSTTIIPVW
jgi:hypothetical protein